METCTGKSLMFHLDIDIFLWCGLSTLCSFHCGGIKLKRQSYIRSQAAISSNLEYPEDISLKTSSKEKYYLVSL